MAWERRHGQFYYYHKVRAGGRVPALINSGRTVDGADTGNNQAAPCATPQLGEVGLKKEAGPWPAFLECLRAAGDYRALAARYPAHTLPQPGESLTAWAERRSRAHGAADGSTARMMG